MPEFVHLHNHSDFSLLDGAESVEKMAARAAELGCKHLALTDHGNMFGALKFYAACKKAGLNPIVGCEFYVASGSRLIKRGTEGGNKYYHLVLLARNEVGYKNLLKLTSAGFVEGFYYKPRIDNEIMAKYSEGLICTSACIGGEIPQNYLNGKPEEAKAAALRYRDMFGEGNFYLELQDHGIPEQKIANEAIIKLSKETGIPMIVTNDCHYLTREDANAQDIILCIGTGRKKNETNRMHFDGEEFYMKTPEQMAALFPDHPEVIANTVELAEKCNLEIKFPGPLLPDFDLPEGFTLDSDYLRHITYEGLKDRYGEVTVAIKERAEFELKIIIDMGFTGYFLIVWDYIHWSREHDIPVGPGRGSGAGSIVAYAMTITDIDPLKYGLLFERFLNPERVSMPDFDIDFCFEGRQTVIDHVTEKYGKDKVGQIITFGTLKAKAVIRDVSRVLDIPYAEADTISKLIPDELKMTLTKALEKEPKLKEIAEQGGVYAELLDVAMRLEGLNRHSSTHAAGVVIGKTELTDYVPLYRDSKTGAISTQYTMDRLEDCGLVKMDFLGLKTLTLIKNAETLVKKILPDFDIAEASEEDEATFKMLGEGKSTCIFQFESSGMQGILKQAQPNTIEDLIALNALYRPGPMQFIPQFIDSKMGRMPIKYPDPSLEEILKPTYGVIVYQEQVMQVAQIIGGFSLGKADILRRAMGKKKVAEMDRMKIEFVAGAKEKGHSEKHAIEIFEMLEPFAGYGFNKSHAAAYSVLAYHTAYLKANHPAEFMAANLTNEINNPDKLTAYIAEAAEMCIDLLPPDINLSDKYFTVVDNQIVYGLMGIKGVGGAAVDEIIRCREESGAFTSFTNFLERVNLKTVNRKVLEVSIQSGLFDRMDVTRATLMHNLDRLIEFVSASKSGLANGQSSLFDSNEHAQFHEIELIHVPEWPEMDLLTYEKANLGFYFSGHPMDKYRDIWRKCSNLDLANLERAGDGKSYTVLGMIKSRREIFTKKGDKMAFVQLEDFQGTLEMTFFPKTWALVYERIQVDAIIAVEGKMDKKRGTPQLLVDQILNPDELKEVNEKELHIRLSRGECSEDDLLDYRDFLIPHAGAFPIYLHVPKPASDGEIIVKASGQLKLSGESEILELIKTHPLTGDIWKE
ncbi:MAG: DNA polymerase III subunit alpha [Spirochaetales bacterium]|nr:DNA polymerase III subunit alpha [Spirochaetales bacterium]